MVHVTQSADGFDMVCNSREAVRTHFGTIRILQGDMIGFTGGSDRVSRWI